MEEKRLIYQVLPRLFGNVKGGNIHNGSITENGCGKLNDFTPKALQYIREMGFNHIWYTGIIEHAHQTSYQKYGIAEDYPEIVKGKAGSPYAIKDYYDIDPDLAVDVPNRMAEFEVLIHRSKEAGLKVIIDFVPNHLARHYVSDAKPAGTPDFGETDDKSKSFDRNNNFYYFPNNEFRAPVEVHGDRRWFENPAKVTGNDAFTPNPSINDWYETVKLNYGVDIQNNNHPHFNPTPDTWFKMFHILKYWAEKGVDGFRCDMAEMVPPQFWNWAINLIKRDHPNIIFIAEVYNPALYRQYVFDGKFDYLYDKVGLYDTLRNVMTGSQSASEITRCWQSTSDILQHMLYFNENHDEQRIASTFFSGNADAGKPAMLVASSLTRNPYMLYFGQEIGEEGMDAEGFSGRDGKTTIFDYWKIDKIARLSNNGKFDDALLTPEEINLKAYYKGVLSLFKDHEAMRKGYFYDLVYANLNNPRFDAQKTFLFFRHTDNEVLLIIAHFGNYSYDARILIPQHALETAGLGGEEFFRGENLLNSKEHILFDKQLLLTNGFGVEIKPYSGMIFKIK